MARHFLRLAPPGRSTASLDARSSLTARLVRLALVSRMGCECFKPKTNLDPGFSIAWRAFAHPAPHTMPRLVPGCPSGATEATACDPGSYSDSVGRASCTLCPQGKFQGQANATGCEDCTPGSYCRTGSIQGAPCPGGTYGNSTGLVTVDQCVPVGPGEWAPLGSPLPGELCASRSLSYHPAELCDQRYLAAITPATSLVS